MKYGQKSMVYLEPSVFDRAMGSSRTICSVDDIDEAILNKEILTAISMFHLRIAFQNVP